MWDLPGPGFEPVSPALAGGLLTTAPPGKPRRRHFKPGESESSLTREAGCFLLLCFRPSSCCNDFGWLQPSKGNLHVVAVVTGEGSSGDVAELPALNCTSFTTAVWTASSHIRAYPGRQAEVSLLHWMHSWCPGKMAVSPFLLSLARNSYGAGV